MTHDVLASLLAMALGGAGFAVGLAYFAALKWTVRLYGSPDGSFAAAALTIGRLVGVAILLVLAAKLGAVALLAAFLGFLVARSVALHRARRAG